MYGMRIVRDKLVEPSETRILGQRKSVCETPDTTRHSLCQWPPPVLFFFCERRKNKGEEEEKEEEGTRVGVRWRGRCDKW